MQELFGRILSEHGLAAALAVSTIVGLSVAVVTLYRRNVKLSDRLINVGDKLAAALGRKRSHSERPPRSS